MHQLAMMLMLGHSSSRHQRKDRYELLHINCMCLFPRKSDFGSNWDNYSVINHKLMQNYLTLHQSIIYYRVIALTLHQSIPYYRVIALTLHQSIICYSYYLNFASFYDLLRSYCLNFGSI